MTARSAPPLASNLTAWAGHAIANSAAITLGTAGKACFVVEVQGYQ